MIHGLTPALAEGGKIKIGGLGPEKVSAAGNKFRQPMKYDNFTITKTTRDAKGDLEVDKEVMEALAKDAGAVSSKDGKIRAIPIILHSDSIEDVFPNSYALYTGKRLTCSGDGQKAVRWKLDDKGARVGKSEMACPCPYLKAKGGPVCKPHGTLHCSIAVGPSAVAGVVHRWRTTSIISIQRMIGSLNQILSICGTLKGVPLWLKVETITVSPPGLASTNVQVCHVELRAKDVLKVQNQALQMAKNREALGGRIALDYRAMVNPPGAETETVEEQEEVAAEFHNEDPGNAQVAGQPATPTPQGPQPNAPEMDDRGIPKDDPGAILDDAPTDEPKVSVPQIKRLYTILHAAKKNEDGLKAYLDAQFGIQSTKDIKLSWYDEIVRWAGDKNATVPVAEPGSKG